MMTNAAVKINDILMSLVAINNIAKIENLLANLEVNSFVMKRCRQIFYNMSGT